MKKIIKNSVSVKVIHAFLIGYFLFSSINLPDTFYNFLSNNDTIQESGLVFKIIEKFFKCGVYREDIEDNECKTKSGKVLNLPDYIIPGSVGFTSLYGFIHLKDKAYTAEVTFAFGFHTKIHLPPPEHIV